MTLRIHNRNACQRPGCTGLLEALADHCPVCGWMRRLVVRQGAWRERQGKLPLLAGRRYRRA